MAYVTGDVVANPGGELPFKVVFMQGETVLGEWEVETQEEGEEQIVDFLQSALESQAEMQEEDEDDDKGEGGEDDDDDTEEDEDEDEDEDDKPRRKR